MKIDDKTIKHIPILFSQWSVDESKELKRSSPAMILDKWNTKICSTLTPPSLHDDPLTAEAMQLFTSESEEDQQTIRSMMVDDLIENPNIIDKEKYVKVNQTLLVRILDTLFTYQAKPLPENISTFYYAISLHLQSTLDFMEDFFGNYFDRSEKVPEAYLVIAKENLKKQIKQLKIIIVKQENIDLFLVDIVVENLNEMLYTEAVIITYNNLIYYKTLLNHLLKQRIVQSTQTITEGLYHLNYNEPNFIAYEYGRLKKLIDELPKKEKIDILRFNQKNLNQLSSKVDYSYDPNMPTLKEQVNGWIDEEVKFLENIQLPEKDPGIIIENENKIHTTLSVAKLALLIRLLVIDRIIINKTVAPMLRVVAKIFTTLQKDDISFGSLETKYHAPDKATINGVKEMLSKWINILGKL